GFSAYRIASGLRGPRVVRVAPNGDLFVADSRANRLLVYRLDESGAVTEQSVFASGLNQPYGIAFYPSDRPRWVYVANSGSIVRFPYEEGDMSARGEPEKVVAGLPTGGHWTRDFAVSTDGCTHVVSVGPLSTVDESFDARQNVVELDIA